MNAVNLIPAGGRRRRTSVSASPQTLGVLAGLVGVLVAAVLYVLAANDVTARQSELARVTAAAVSWKPAAQAYAGYTTEATQRTQQMADVTQLVASRFEWSQLLDQIGGLMPAAAALTSLQATTAAPAASTASATTGSLPSVAITGCAASQSTVAQAMVQLHRVRNVSAVTLSSSVDSRTSGAGSGSASSASASGSAGCPFPVQFQVSLTFAAASGATPAAGAATSAAGASTTPAAATPGTTSTPLAAAGSTTAPAQ